MTVKDFVVDHDIDILAVTETWLRPGNIDEVEIGTLSQQDTGYSMSHDLNHDRWMVNSGLKLNQDKTELVLISYRHRSRPSLDFI